MLYWSGQELFKQEMSLKKKNGVGLKKKEENITQARLSTCS